MKLGDTIFNGNQFKNVILNSTSYKRLILGVNLVWSYFSIAIKSFKTRILADGGTYEGESILEDRLQEITPNLFDSASLVITPNGVKTSKLYTIKPNDGTGDLSVVRNTSATRIDENSNIVNVPANVARIDYSNGSPAILSEPQRTNLLTYSEDLSNGAWYKLRTTINSNTIVAPDGNLSADGIYPNNGVNINYPYSGLYTSGNVSYLSKSTGTLTPGTYTFSFFIKKNNLRYIQPRVSAVESLSTSVLSYNILDLENKTIYSNDGVSTVKIKDYSNGFVRYEITFNVSTSATYYFGFWYWKETSVVTDGTLGYNIWGAQLEAGSNATSYIPTTTSSVTRNADVISKSGISNLIGQTEGTLYAEFPAVFLPSTRPISISDGTISNRIAILLYPNRIEALVRPIGTISFYNPIYSLKNKVCIVYTSNSLKLFFNGALIGENNSFSIPNNLNSVRIGNIESEITPVDISLISNAFVSKTALTNEQAKQLTTL